MQSHKMPREAGHFDLDDALRRGPGLGLRDLMQTKHNLIQRDQGLDQVPRSKMNHELLFAPRKPQISKGFSDLVTTCIFRVYDCRKRPCISQ